MTVLDSTRSLIDRTRRLRKFVGVRTAWSAAWQSHRIEAQTGGITVREARRVLMACATSLGIHPGRLVTNSSGPFDRVPHPLGVELILKELAQDWSEYALLDVGCGAGLSLLQAIQRDFQVLMGVEQDESERVRCEMNLRAISGSMSIDPRIRIVGHSCSELRLPDQPLVVTISSHLPTDGMLALTGRLRRSLAFQPRRMLVCCASGENAAQLQQSGFLDPLVPRSLWWGWTLLAPQPERCGRERVTSRRPVPERSQASAVHPVCS